MELPAVSYPEGTFNVSDAETRLRLDGAKALGQVYEALQAFEMGRGKHTAVFTAGSPDWESLLSPEGHFRIVNYRWWRGSQPVHVAVLAERYPRLCEYFRTRTIQFIEYQRAELQFVSSETDRAYITEQLDVLCGEFAELERSEDD